MCHKHELQNISRFDSHNRIDVYIELINVCLHLSHRSVSVRKAWEIRDERGRENSHIWSVQTVYLLCTDKSRCRGTLFLPSFYFLLNSCVCLWEGAWRKGKEGNWYAHITVCALTSHTDAWLLLGTYQLFRPGLLPERQWVLSVVVSLAFQHPCSCHSSPLILVEWWLSSGWPTTPHWGKWSTVPAVSLISRDDASVTWVFSTSWEWEILFARFAANFSIFKVARLQICPEMCTSMSGTWVTVL